MDGCKDQWNAYAVMIGHPKIPEMMIALSSVNFKMLRGVAISKLWDDYIISFSNAEYWKEITTFSVVPSQAPVTFCSN